MKKQKNILMTGIATALTAVIIYISGGSTVLAALLGLAGFCTIPGTIHLNSNEERNKNNLSYIQQTTTIKNSPKTLNQNKDQTFAIDFDNKELTNKVSIAPIKQYDDIEEQIIIPELITIDAQSQQESVLVRRRKKETEERTKPNNNYKI